MQLSHAHGKFSGEADRSMPVLALLQYMLRVLTSYIRMHINYRIMFVWFVHVRVFSCCHATENGVITRSLRNATWNAKEFPITHIFILEHTETFVTPIAENWTAWSGKTFLERCNQLILDRRRAQMILLLLLFPMVRPTFDRYAGPVDFTGGV